MKPGADRSSPPRLADRLLRALLPEDAYEIVAGDLEEMYRKRVRPGRSRLPAALWYWLTAFRSLIGYRGARRSAASPSHRGSRPMQDLFADVRFALRGFRRSPGLVLAVTLTLALGVGANTAIFNVLYATLLRPLPYPDPERIVVLNETNPERGWTEAYVAAANFLDWRQRTDSFAAMAVHSWVAGVALTGGDRPVWVPGTGIHHDFFAVFGIQPLLGRGFTEGETWGEESDAVVIGHGLWRRHFAADPDVIGRRMQLDGRDRTVVGVMPEGFSYPGDDTEIWWPLGLDPEDRNASWFRRAHWLYGIARLAPGVELDTAAEELATIAASLEREYPDTNAAMGVKVRTLHRALVGDVRLPLLILTVAVGAVLVIACANIANLLLARSIDRSREVSIRAALGAGRLRIARQLLTESLVLAVVGGAVGIGATAWLTGALLRLAGDLIPRSETIAFGGPSLVFGLGVTLLTGLAVGLVPAIQASASGAPGTAGAAGRSASEGQRASRTRGALVVAEVALALVLVTAAGLMIRSVSRLTAVDPGFDPDNVLAATLELPSARYPEDSDVLGALERLDTRLSSRPGIRDVAVATSLPLLGTAWTSDFWIEGRPIGGDAPVVEFSRRTVSGDYLQTMGVPLLAGRTFDERDHAEAPPVVLVNETLAREHFPDRSPIGARVTDTTEPEEDDWLTIIGVVGDQKVEGLDSRAWPEMMIPLSQNPERYVHLLIRWEESHERPDTALREELDAMDPDLPIVASRTFAEILTGTISVERLLTVLLTAFAAMALLLATVGIAGVVSAAVVRRTREIGVRVALGASRSQVVGMVLRQGMSLVGIGLAIGLALSLLGARALRTVLYETRSVDVSTLVAVIALLSATAFLAMWIPARRAARVDPVRSLTAD